MSLEEGTNKTVIDDGISITELVVQLKGAIAANRPVFIQGGIGIGKSEGVRTTAKELSMELIDVRASMLSPQEIRGVPVVDRDLKATTWYPPIFLPRDNKKRILFLDELNSAPTPVQSACYQLIHDRRVGEYALPDNTYPCGAGNRLTDKSVVNEMPKALRGRFGTIKVRADLDSFMTWAIKNNIHPIVMSFLKQFQHYLYDANWKQYTDAFPNPRCYDSATEVMTERGFVLFRDLKPTDKVASLNKDGVVEFVTPTKYFTAPYEGDMIEFWGAQYNLLVTPNHNMFAKKAYHKGISKLIQPAFQAKGLSHSLAGRGHLDHNNVKGTKWETEEWAFQTAESIYDIIKNSGSKSFRFRKDAIWTGKDTEYIELIGSTPKNKGQTIQLPAIPFFKFLGWFYSEGNLNKLLAKRGSYSIRIRQVSATNRKEIADIISEMGFKPNNSDKHSQVTFNSKELYTLLEPSKTGWDKKMVRDFLTYSPRLLAYLLETFIKGDGWTTNGETIVAVGSMQLANDIQEIAMRLGYSANLSFRPSYADGKTKFKDSGVWTVAILTKRYLRPIVQPHHIQKRKYTGMVYCVEVPNHTLLVRRDGQAIWCGNSWKFVSDVVNSVGESNISGYAPLIGGFVSDGVGSEFVSYSQLHTQLPKMEDILAGKVNDWKERKLDPEIKESVNYALSTSLYTYILRSSKPYENALKAFVWATKNLDEMFATMVTYELVSNEVLKNKYEEIITTKEFTQFVKAYGKDFVQTLADINKVK